jgi:hypothetical protein
LELYLLLVLNVLSLLLLLLLLLLLEVFVLLLRGLYLHGWVERLLIAGCFERGFVTGEEYLAVSV